MATRPQLGSRFRASISQIDELLAIYRFIHASSSMPAKDNVLRAALTMLVSAIDTSIHELVVGLILGKIENPLSDSDLSRQKIGIHCMLETDPVLRLAKVEADLRMQYSKATFQTSNQIESALAEIGINKIWTRLSSRLNKRPEDVKLRLNLMVRRRNQIVHESDLDVYHNPQQISLEMIEELYEFTSEFVGALFEEFSNSTGPMCV